METEPVEPGSTGDSTTRPEELIARKRELRRHFRHLRDSMTPEQVRALSAALCRRLADWAPVRQARTVLAYLAFGNELDLRPIFAMLPEIDWVAPRCADQRLVLHPYEPTRLVKHRFGMQEPHADLPVVDPVSVDVVLAPGLAFDRRGGRLGFGGGFYDCFLPTTPALRVGISYDVSLVDELPCGTWDQRVHWVATPTQLVHCTPLWPSDCPPSARVEA
jgi:5-formyltetrahydrofolate cyclo-ligase